MAAYISSPARIAGGAATPADVRIDVKLNCHSYALASACAGTTSRTYASVTGKPTASAPAAPTMRPPATIGTPVRGSATSIPASAPSATCGSIVAATAHSDPAIH